MDRAYMGTLVRTAALEGKNEYIQEYRAEMGCSPSEMAQHCKEAEGNLAASDAFARALLDLAFKHLAPTAEEQKAAADNKMKALDFVESLLVSRLGGEP